MNKERCATCGTVLNIHGCLNCGAPVCCPKCCADDSKAAYAEKCMQACAGLLTGALDGGWTAAGMSAYAKKLEDEIEVLCAQRDAWKEVAEHQYGLLRTDKFGAEADYPVSGALDAWASGRHPVLRPNAISPPSVP